MAGVTLEGLLTSGGQKDCNSTCSLKKQRAFNFSTKGGEEEASGMPLVFHCGPG